MSDFLQWAIIAFIVLAIGFVVFRSGQTNPAATGALDTRLNTLQTQQGSLKTRLGHMEAELQELQANAATGKDIARLEEVISTVRAEMSGHKEVSMRTSHSVDRIERLLLEKALK